MWCAQLRDFRARRAAVKRTPELSGIATSWTAMPIAEQHDLARADLAGLARFDLAVDGHRPSATIIFAEPPLSASPVIFSRLCSST